MTHRSDTALLRRLVEDIGPRWSADTGNRLAAETIRDELVDRGFGSVPGTSVRTQAFPFSGWKPVNTPVLSITAPELRDVPVAPMEYSGLTPAEGVEGVLRKAGEAHVVPGFLDWPQYGLFDMDGRLLALFIGHEGLSGWDAPPIPLHNPEPAFPYPMAMLGQADHRRIAEELEQGATLTARFSGGGEPAVLTGHNVVARIEGDQPDTVVFTAHIDTSFRSPGANNNAGGVQVLATLARELLRELRTGGRGDGGEAGAESAVASAAGAAAGGTHPSVEFLFCDATEWQFLGSRHYLFRRGTVAAAPPIIANVNIDSITSGTEAFFVSSDDWMKARIEEVIDTQNLRDRFDSVTTIGGVEGSDDHSFIQAGIHATEILFWPCETYKTPADDMSGVDEARVADAVATGRAFLDSIHSAVANGKEQQ